MPARVSVSLTATADIAAEGSDLVWSGVREVSPVAFKPAMQGGGREAEMRWRLRRESGIRGSKGSIGVAVTLRQSPQFFVENGLHFAPR